MTARNRLALTIILACMKLAMLMQPAPAHSGEVRRAKKVGRAMAKPIRAQGRADAGYPVATTAANVTGLATGIPVGLAFGILKFIARQRQ